MLRWLFRNIPALVMALGLAITIWVTALNEEDPFQDKVFPQSVPVTIINVPEGMMLIGDPPPAVDVRLRAPASVWAALKAEQIRVVADLGQAGSGPIVVPLQADVDSRDARVTGFTPAEVTLRLEPVVTRSVPVRLELNGDPAIGYQTGQVITSANSATVSGPASAAGAVSEVLARLNLGGTKQTISQSLTLQPVDSAGQPIAGVTVQPASVEVTVRVEQLGGFRDVAVKALIEGQVAPGYRLTNILVSPPVVTLFSSDPALVADLPGFVNTEQLDISRARDDIEARLGLALPPGVSLVGDQTVVVQVSVAAIESSLTIERELEIQGLGTGLAAVPSPTTVDVILAGPLTTLDALTPESVRVVVDLLDLRPGQHQVTPKVLALPEGVTVQTVLPATIEVQIAGPGTPTAAIAPAGTRTPTRAPTLATTRTPTRTPTLTPSAPPPTPAP